jgi:hypothetical protein
MTSGLGGLIAIMALIGLPTIAGGLFEWTNKKIWMWRLSRRIGDVPEEAFIPADVRSGWRPSGMVLALCFPVGILLLVLANNLASPALRAVGTPLFGLPLLVVTGLILRFSLRGMNPGTQVDGAAPEECRQHVERLSERLGREREEGEPAREYLQGWRAGHLLELACAELNTGKTLNEEHALQAEKDLDAVLARSSDAELKRTARGLRALLERLRVLAATQASKSTAG